MDEQIRTTIANEGWLLVAILTLALTSLAGIAGLEALAGVITIVGWFVLTPVLLFWGDEVALLLEDETADATRDAEAKADTEADPLEELKRRYAAGEIDDAEFERRLERLVAVDEIPDDAIGSGSATETTTDATIVDGAADAAPVDETATNDAARADPLERDRERER
ncbi:SHOCT domain-containing protein [Haloterrigena salinisoli]|uniref:SHOCT domain-containing protein n=1 Tax=Haloterrigena salinisoli TaxID=3132747 RepID=UPI0030CDD6C1